MFFTPNVFFWAIACKNPFTLVFLLLLLEIQACATILVLHIISIKQLLADTRFLLIATQGIKERQIEIQEVSKLGKIPFLI